MAAVVGDRLLDRPVDVAVGAAGLDRHRAPEADVDVGWPAAAAGTAATVRARAGPVGSRSCERAQPDRLIGTLRGEPAQEVGGALDRDLDVLDDPLPVGLAAQRGRSGP